MKKEIKQTTMRGIDPLLGYSYSSGLDISLSNNEVYRDSLIYFGDKDKAKLTIVILGGSTSDINYEGSWLRPFYELLKEDVLLISAAMVGYSTSQEVLKLIRDILPLAPDIVISLNGVNDLGFIQCYSPEFPMMHRYQVNTGKFIVDKYGEKESNREDFFERKLDVNSQKISGMNNKLALGNLILGYRNNLKAYESWFNNIKISKSICDTFNIEYLSFLQPIFSAGEYNRAKSEDDIFQEYIFNIHGVPYDKALEDFYTHAREIVSLNREFMIDLVDIFKNKESMYSDPRHPNMDGNKLLAKNIYKNLVNYTIYKKEHMTI